ncbi:MAG: glycogen debranching protein GlgX [Hyphomicrobiales bacterium]
MTYAFRELDYIKPELGADFIGEGTHFAVFSAHAEAIELCLFSEDGTEELTRLALPNRQGDVFSGFLPGVGPGTVYGYRAYGPYAPQEGHRFNANKLLLDPYARDVRGKLLWDDALYGYGIGNPDGDLSFDERDSAAFMPKGVVIDPQFDWQGDMPLRRPFTETVIYEAHVRGLTMLHPDVPEADRGCYLGMASEPVIDHLKRLGITAIELLPVHYFIDDRYLVEKGLRNYWGYQTLGFFAPQPRFARCDATREFKEMVRRFHAAGIEVLMDVVFNHTAEGNECGPTLSFRGLDNASYYRLSPEDARYSFDQTGTGNTLNVAHPMVLRLVLDSLRYFADVMHVDGFRFDLASTLGREAHGFDREGGFFDAIRQDPLLAGVKLIAEPWDIGEGGYQVGGFPYPFREWNDKYRDTVRRFWRADGGMIADLANHVAGSALQFDHTDRPATSSVNFLTAHDGFTLMDVVSYQERHNEANGEGNADGHDNNLSDNMGAEGETENAEIVAARTRRRRNMMATLLVSQGVPMVLAGDELGNSQGGNNNAYAQDNEIGWVDWTGEADPFLEFCRRLITLRQQMPVLRQDRFLKGAGRAGEADIVWLRPDGGELGDGDFGNPELKIVGVLLRASREGGEELPPALLVFNATDACDFRLPAHAGRGGVCSIRRATIRSRRRFWPRIVSTCRRRRWSSSRGTDRSGGLPVCGASPGGRDPEAPAGTCTRPKPIGPDPLKVWPISCSARSGPEPLAAGNVSFLKRSLFPHERIPCRFP